MNEREIIDRATEIDDASRRSAFLGEACGDDSKLRNRIDQLLKEHYRQGSLIDKTAANLPPTVDLPSVTEKVGTTVGPYKLQEQIGEGGMGVVYVAEQREPVRRRVALKVIKPGMDTREVLARFAAERQALAMMDHPHIARVLDAGATESGRPYFVMELVRGIPITDFCDKNKFSASRRLELFVDVCHAIQHAHQKGIIHRDIKPSNVLVTSHDGKPLVKVIDFGLAKAINQQLTDLTIYTQFAQMVGTPLYMSPEQAEMSALDVDTRADIYSLGVLLYELLTGSPPFDKERFKKAAFDEMRRIIRDEEPSKPSQKISSMGEAASSVCLDRDTDPRKLRQLMRGDLDWIVMKALEKDRDRRYETANGFANDIRRYLVGEAVVAAPPRVGYRVKKFIRRNKGPAAAASLLLLALLGGIIGTTLGLVEAKRQEKIAVEALNLAQQRTKEAGEAKEKEVLATKQAQDRADELELVTEFQQAMLSNVDAEAMGRSIIRDARSQIERALRETGSEIDIESRLAVFDEMAAKLNGTNVALQVIDEHVLARAVAMIEQEFANQPLTRAALQNSIAVTYRAIGLYEMSLPLQESALATRRKELDDLHPDTLTSINDMGTLYQAMGRNDEAEEHLHEALDARRRVLGGEHPATLNSITNMGFLYQAIDEQNKAAQFYLEALEGWRKTKGVDHPSTLAAMVHVGELHQLNGNYDEALSYYRDALAGRRRVQGDDHPDTLIILSVLGLVLNEKGNADEAEPYSRAALEGWRRVLGDDHPRTLTANSNLGWVLASMQQYGEAETYYRAALVGRRRVLGEGHPQTLRSITSMGSLYKSMKQYDKAAPYYRQVLESRRQSLGDDNWETTRAMNDLGELFQVMNKFDEARPLFEEALRRRRKVLGTDNPRTIRSIHMMANLLRDLGRLDEAKVLCAEAIGHANRVMPRNSYIGILLESHGQTLTMLEQYADSELALLEAHKILETEYGPDHRQTINVTRSLVDLYIAWHVAEPNKAYNDEAAQWSARLAKHASDTEETKNEETKNESTTDGVRESDKGEK